AHVHIGQVYQVLGERGKAHQAFRQAITVFRSLMQDLPDDPTYPRELATALYILAADLYGAGRIQEANGYCAESVRVCRVAVRQHPGDTDSVCQLASFLCQCFDPKLRDPRGAVEEARRAVALAPEVPKTWLTLGIAFYRSG